MGAEVDAGAAAGETSGSPDNLSSLALRSLQAAVNASHSGLAAQDQASPLPEGQPQEDGNLLEVLLANSTLLTIFGLMGLGAVARRRNWLTTKSADRIRWVCFEYLMPAVLLRSIWIAPVDVGLSAVAVLSAVFHVARFFILLLLVRLVEPLHRQRQGWLLLTTQGEMLALLYPLLLATPHLSERALACCILWDFGGNMWLCQGVLFGIADHYFEGQSRGRNSGGLLQVAALVAPSKTPRHSLQVDDVDLENDIDDERAKKQVSTARTARRAIVSVITKPLLIYCFMAFVFNFSGLALPQALDSLLWALSVPFKPGIYFVVGFYGAAHALSFSDLLTVLQALLIRYTAATVMSVGVNWVIDEPVFCQTITLALFSPSTSNVIHIIAEKGSGEEQLKLTVCSGFASTIISTVLHLALVRWFSA